MGTRRTGEAGAVDSGAAECAERRRDRRAAGTGRHAERYGERQVSRVRARATPCKRIASSSQRSITERPRGSLIVTFPFQHASCGFLF